MARLGIAPRDDRSSKKSSGKRPSYEVLKSWDMSHAFPAQVANEQRRVEEAAADAKRLAHLERLLRDEKTALVETMTTENRGQRALAYPGVTNHASAQIGRTSKRSSVALAGYGKSALTPQSLLQYEVVQNHLLALQALQRRVARETAAHATVDDVTGSERDARTPAPPSLRFWEVLRPSVAGPPGTGGRPHDGAPPPRVHARGPRPDPRLACGVLRACFTRRCFLNVLESATSL